MSLMAPRGEEKCGGNMQWDFVEGSLPADGIADGYVETDPSFNADLKFCRPKSCMGVVGGFGHVLPNGFYTDTYYDDEVTDVEKVRMLWSKRSFMTKRDGDQLTFAESAKKFAENDWNKPPAEDAKTMEYYMLTLADLMWKNGFSLYMDWCDECASEVTKDWDGIYAVRKNNWWDEKHKNAIMVALQEAVEGAIFIDSDGESPKTCGQNKPLNQCPTPSGFCNAEEEAGKAQHREAGKSKMYKKADVGRHVVRLEAKVEGKPWTRVDDSRTEPDVEEIAKALTEAGTALVNELTRDEKEAWLEPHKWTPRDSVKIHYCIANKKIPEEEKAQMMEKALKDRNRESWLNLLGKVQKPDGTI